MSQTDVNEPGGLLFGAACHGAVQLAAFHPVTIACAALSPSPHGEQRSFDQSAVADAGTINVWPGHIITEDGPTLRLRKEEQRDDR